MLLIRLCFRKISFIAWSGLSLNYSSDSSSIYNFLFLWSIGSNGNRQGFRGNLASCAFLLPNSFSCEVPLLVVAAYVGIINQRIKTFLELTLESKGGLNYVNFDLFVNLDANMV